MQAVDAMFDASGQYIGIRRRVTALPSPPPPPLAPSPAIDLDLHGSLASFLSLSSFSCPASFSQWLSLPHALLIRHLRNSGEVALLQRIAASATQLDRLLERLYDAIVEGESLEHVQRHLPHRCPSLPDSPPATLPSDSSESSASSSSSDSSASAAEQAALAALSASLAPFFHCSFPAAHKPSFASDLTASIGRHARSIGGVFVELTEVLLELQAGLSALQSSQQLNGRLSEELQLEGCEALAATKAAVAGLEGHLVDRITALLSARLTHEQLQQAEVALQSPAPAAASAALASASAIVDTVHSRAATSPSAGPAAAVDLNCPSTAALLAPPQPPPPGSPSPSVASSSSSSASSSTSSTSSSSLSPNTRLDLILGLQPAAATKRKSHTAPDTRHIHSLPSSAHAEDEQNADRTPGHSRPSAKRMRTENSDQGATVQLSSSRMSNDSDPGSAVAPASMRVLFTSASVATGGGGDAAQSSVPHSPQVVPTATVAECVVAVSLAVASPARPPSPACDMQLSLASSTSSSAAPASPSSCPPSPVISPLMSASQPTRAPTLTRLAAGPRSHSMSHPTASTEEQKRTAIETERGRLVADGVSAAVVSIPLSPNVEMSVDDADDDFQQRMTPQLEPQRSAVAASSGASEAAETAVGTAAVMVGNDGFFPPARSASLSRCSQERVDVAGMAEVDVEGGSNVAMLPVDSDPLQLHSSQPQTMV